jgi:hypothetical protein
MQKIEKSVKNADSVKGAFLSIRKEIYDTIEKEVRR